MKALAVTTVLFGFMVSGLAAQTPATQRATSGAELQGAPQEVKRRTLNDLAALRYSPRPEEVKDLIATGLADPDSDVRLSAIYAVAGRASAMRFPGTTPEKRAVGNAERPALRQLRPLILDALADESPRVRQGAVIALGNLEYEPGHALNDVVLPPDAANALKAHFGTETSAAVRAEIVKAFALSLHNPGRDDLLLQALDDTDPEVVQYGIMGLAQSKPMSALDKVVGLLSHPNRIVRVQVGQTLAAYGAAAKPYLGTISAAAKAEQEPAVKKTLEAAVALIEDSR